jgi:hypothetical protein
MLINDNKIEEKIFLIRNQKVMIDTDLALLYCVDTKRLNEQVKRNPGRFPSDFMFQLTETEWADMRSQFATSNPELNRHGGRRTMPYVFTEHGVLMLSSVLNSERASLMNLQIMRIYVRQRELIHSNKDILRKMEIMERTSLQHDLDLKSIFKYLKQLVMEPRPRIGFKPIPEVNEHILETIKYWNQ